MELPGGYCVLVDGGGFYNNRFDVGARVVGPLLWKRKIATVDILVLSHPDPDHLNGLLFIARYFHVREVWMNLEPADAQPYRDFLDIISEKGVRVVGPKDLLRPRVINGVRFEVLYPSVDFLERKATERGVTLPDAQSVEASALVLPEEIDLLKKIGEFPEVEMATAASPGRPCAWTRRAKICSKP